VLTAKGMPDLEVPILHETESAEMKVNVWKANILAIDQGDAAAEWINLFLAEHLGERKLRFVHFKESFTRHTHEKYAPGHQTGWNLLFCCVSILSSRTLLIFVLSRLRGCVPNPADCGGIAQ
jgi:uncharacterized protein YcbX